MRRNGLITGLVIVLGVVVATRAAVQFGFPSFLKAQNAAPAAGDGVGTHAAFFDSGGNIKIANLVKAKGGNKITVMVDINAGTGEINSVLAAADGLTKIVRIVGIDHNTTSAQASTIAGALNGSNIPSGTIVVFGNEVNNLDKEWKLCPEACPGRTGEAAGAYADIYRAFQGAAGGKYTPVPSPLDLYNGVYTDPSPFIGTGIYNGNLVANVYEVGSGLEQGKAYPGTILAYTEYGPDPAKSLQEHINFYKTNPPDKLATTLIPDKCNPGTDQWLFYIAGKIYDAEGNEIDPVTCDKSTAHAGLPPAGDYYKRFVYPFYRSSSIQGVTPDVYMKTALADDYSMTCSNPADYQTNNTAGSIADLIKYQQSSCRDQAGDACLFKPEATLSVTSAGLNKLFGVLRNENEVKWRRFDYSTAADNERVFTNRFESVEQWFGANNPSLHSPGGPVEYVNQTPEDITGLHEGPFYKLMPLYGQCVAQREVLKATFEICEVWQTLPENAGQECSLFSKKIAGTKYDYRDLYENRMLVYERERNDKEHDDKTICDVVYNTPDVQPPEEAVAIANDMSKVDLYQETAYRPAFLVMSTEVDDSKPEVGSSNTTQQVRSRSVGATTGKHKVDFLVYHVPDTITDMKEGVDGTYDDIITRTAKTFTPQQVTDDAVKDWQINNRDVLKSKMDVPSAAPEIDCKGGDCETNLKKALIDFINAYSAAQLTESCATPVTENAESGTRIGSQLAPVDMGETDVNNWATSKEGPIGTAKSEIQIQEYRNDSGVANGKRNPPPQTRIYNITPHGFRTKYVADAFNAFFAEAQLTGQFKDDDKYLTTFESIFGSSLDSDSDVVEYSKPVLNPDGTQVVDANGVAQFEQKEVGSEITLSPQPFPVTAKIPWLARVFNFSTRGMVQQISSAGENLLECARSVADPKKNTEDFLLRCQSRGSAVGSPAGSNNPPSDLGNPASGFEQFEIQYWNGSLINFSVPPQLVVDAANAAAAKHGCDPNLVIATAHSEDQLYTNHQTENSATALGVWQFTRDNWYRDVWSIPFFTAAPATSSFVAQDGSNFDCRNAQSATCARTNVYAAADAACRLLNAIGANGQYDSQSNFVQAFSVPGNAFNQYGRVWNAHRPQGEYVWRLWHALKDPTNRPLYKNQNTSLL